MKICEIGDVSCDDDVPRKAIFLGSGGAPTVVTQSMEIEKRDAGAHFTPGGALRIIFAQPQK